MKILHVFRAPVGGLFRHVRDLCRGQSAAGHDVGLVCDSTTGGPTADTLLAGTLPFCSLGVHRIPIARLPGIGDLQAALGVARIAQKVGAQVIHGHGAKGGVYGRLAGSKLDVPSVYTAHGGSFHYRWGEPAGAVFLAAEWGLSKIGTGVVFVCEYERGQFAQKIGLGGIKSVVVHNGLWPEEFSTEPPVDGARDIVFIGDMREIKGVDVLIEALALVAQRRAVTAALVGDGPAMESYKALAANRGLTNAVHFPGRLPTHAALASGRMLVLPSRSESFPYVVLEAAAAAKPIIASGVGGIPEILPSENLVPPDEPLKLAARIAESLAAPGKAQSAALALQERVARQFGATAMTEKILQFYQTLI